MIYRLLLRLLPRTFRERFGADMTDLFEDRLRAAKRRSAAAVAALWMRTLADVTMAAWRERRHVRRNGRKPQETTPMWMWMDLQQAWRVARSRRGFSLAVIVTLGLGIGAATSVFSVANALVLRALPYPHADRLLHLFEHEDREGFSGNVALGNLDDWCGIEAFDACGAYAMSDVNLAGGEAPERVRSAGATAGLFDVLGVQPVAGRVFSAAEADTKMPVVLVSAAASRQMFDDDAVGRTLRLDGAVHTVVGILPAIPGFEDVAVWRPLSTRNQTRGNHANRAVARLRNGVAASIASEQLDARSRQLQQDFAATNAHWWARVEPLQNSLMEPLAGTIGVLATLVGALLALCVTGVAALVVGQGAARRRELTVRMALGASRRRLVVQLFVEHAVLAVAGALAGCLLARWSVRSILAVLPSHVALWRDPGVDLTALGFAVVVAVVACVCFGLLPALGLVRESYSQAGLGSRQGSARIGRARAALAVVQVALATILLSAAALLGTVLVRVLTTDPGFKPENVLTFSVNPPRATYADAAALQLLDTALMTRLARLPEVEAIAATMNVPMSGSSVMRGVVRDGEALPERGHARLTLFQVATPDYFETIGIRLADGRDFSGEDSGTSQPVVIVNRTLATMLWPGERAVGHQLLVHTDEKTPRLVVGVIPDVKQARYEGGIEPEFYVPLTQSPRRALSFVIRQRAPLSRATLQHEVSAVDPALPVYDVQSLESLLAQSIASRQAVTRLAGLFGATAILLAAVGLFGLVAGGVAERTREIGVRVALGATPGRVARSLVWRGLATAGAGGAIGLTAALVTTRALTPLLNSTPPSPGTAIVAVVAVLVASSGLACWIPARRALRVDPVVALRSE